MTTLRAFASSLLILFCSIARAGEPVTIGETYHIRSAADWPKAWVGGYDALSRGKVDEALALFKRNVDACPNSANAWNGLADAYAKAGRLRDAASASDRSVELATQFEDPNTPYFRQQAKKANERLQRESAAPR